MRIVWLAERKAFRLGHPPGCCQQGAKAAARAAGALSLHPAAVHDRGPACLVKWQTRSTQNALRESASRFKSGDGHATGFRRIFSVVNENDQDNERRKSNARLMSSWDAGTPSNLALDFASHAANAAHREGAAEN